MNRCFQWIMLTTIFSILPLVAQADIYDRIDQCEVSGGSNGCVYDLLRQIAGQTTGGGSIFCSCEPNTVIQQCYVYQSSQGSTNGSRYFLNVAHYDLVFVNLQTGSELSRKRIDCSTLSDYQPQHACEKLVQQDPRCR